MYCVYTVYISFIKTYIYSSGGYSLVYTPIHKSPGSLLSRLHGPYFLPTSLLPLSSLELLLIDSLEGKGKQNPSKDSNNHRAIHPQVKYFIVLKIQNSLTVLLPTYSVPLEPTLLENLTDDAIA